MSTSVQEFDFSVNLLRALLWRHDDAENLQSILTQKSAWYLENETDFWDNWFTDVFNLETANDFGCSVWALILGVPLNLITPANQGPQFGYGSMAYSTPYNIAPVSDQPVTAASVTSVRRAGGWQGDRALSATARTNQIGISEDFTNVGWSKTRSSVVVSGTIQTLRGTSAQKMVEDSSAATTHFLQRTSTGTFTSGQFVALSAYVRAAERRQVRLGVGASTAFAATSVIADLDAGTVTTFGGTPASSGIQFAGGDWWRVWCVVQATGSGAANGQIMPCVGGTSSYNGDGTSGMFYDAYQIETVATGTTPPTPYIACPTTAAVSVTDYTIASNGIMTFAVAPGDVAADNIYVSGQYTSGTVKTLTNALIAHSWTNNHRYNFNRGNFGVSQAGAGLSLQQKRILLQLRYYKLISRCTVPEINERVSAILADQGSVYVLDSNNMKFVTYVFGFQPNSALQFILENFDVLPRPAGVGIRYIISTRPAFGFGSFNKNFNNGTFWAEN